MVEFSATNDEVCTKFWEGFVQFSLNRVRSNDANNGGSGNKRGPSISMMIMLVIFLFSFQQKCTKCSELGATLACFKRGCNKMFHYACARDSGAYLVIYID